YPRIRAATVGRAHLRDHETGSGRCLGRHRLAPPFEILEVAPSGLQQLLILDVPDVRRPGGAGEEGEVGDQLAEPEAGGMAAEWREGLQQLVWDRSVHGRVSPTVGKWPSGTLTVRTTSTRINTPGQSFAIRVARVTPSLSINAPSEPR